MIRTIDEFKRHRQNMAINEAVSHSSSVDLMKIAEHFMRSYNIDGEANDGFGDCLQVTSDFVDWSKHVYGDRFKMVAGTISKVQFRKSEHGSSFAILHSAALDTQSNYVVDLTHGQFDHSKLIAVYPFEEFASKYDMDDYNKTYKEPGDNINESTVSESVIAPSTETGTMSFWHGGNLDDYDLGVSHKPGRWEYGPGLYLTTQYDTAKKYAKGSRKFYMVTVREGIDLNNSNLSVSVFSKFVHDYVIKNKQGEVNAAIDRRQKNGMLNGNTFLTILINNKAIKNTDTHVLRKFFVSNEIDYLTVDNAFGWHERMLVLFNMNKIYNVTHIKPGDKIEVYDLPREFAQ